MSEEQKNSNKVYLGDSVYATFDGYALEITTENGLPTDPSNRVYLEPEILLQLVRFAKKNLQNSLFWEKVRDIATKE